MRITHLRLPSHSPAATRAFFHDTLQLPLEGETLRVGWSRIDPVPAAAAVGALHLAFNVDPARFEAALAWLHARATLLHAPDGQARFALARGWQSESVYFAGPDGAVLELIARRRHVAPAPRQGPFHGSELLCLSEVGLPSDDVSGVARSLGNHFRMHPLDTPASGFAALGDDEGLLIVVDSARRWFPEQRQLPWAHGVAVQLQGPPPGLGLHDAQGWQLCSVA